MQALTCIHCGQAKMECMALPAGVRFDPSDEELLVHLAAKMGRSNMMSHPLIDDFISFLDGEDGICGTHPEKLPGNNISVFCLGMIIRSWLLLCSYIFHPVFSCPFRCSLSSSSVFCLWEYRCEEGWEQLPLLPSPIHGIHYWDTKAQENPC